MRMCVLKSTIASSLNCFLPTIRLPRYLRISLSIHRNHSNNLVQTNHPARKQGNNGLTTYMRVHILLKLFFFPKHTTSLTWNIEQKIGIKTIDGKQKNPRKNIFALFVHCTFTVRSKNTIYSGFSSVQFSKHFIALYEKQSNRTYYSGYRVARQRNIII